MFKAVDGTLLLPNFSPHSVGVHRQRLEYAIFLVLCLRDPLAPEDPLSLVPTCHRSLPDCWLEDRCDFSSASLVGKLGETP